MGRRGLGLALLLLAAPAAAQQPAYIQSLTQFADTICPTNGDSIRRVAAGTGYECYAPGAGAGDIASVGDCTTGDCFNTTVGATGNSLIFEGTTADAFEGTLVGADFASSDKTITIPNETGTVCTTGSVCTGYQSVLTNSAGLRAALSDENGTGAALFNSATSPTFLTDVTVPLIYGGTGVDGDLQLGSTNNADDGSIVLQPGLTSVPDLTAVIAFDATLNMTASTAGLYAYQAGKKGGATSAVWTVDTDLTGTGAGGLLFAFQPTIKNATGTAITDMGDWSAFVNLPALNADTAAVTFPTLRGLDSRPTFGRTSTGTMTVSSYHVVRDEPTINNGANVVITNRIGLEMAERLGGGTQANVYGLLMGDQTASTFVAAVNCDVTSGTGKYCWYSAGTAPSIHNGAMTIGGTGAATSGYDLEVDGKANVKAGTASDIAAVGGVLNVNTTAVGNVGTGTDDLITYSVPANTLGTNGDSFHFRAAGTVASTAATKQLRVRFGSTTLLDTGAALFAISTAYEWSLSGWCVRSTGVSAEKCAVELHTNVATISAVDYTTPTETLSGALTLKLDGTATNNNDIVEEMFEVRWYPANT